MHNKRCQNCIYWGTEKQKRNKDLTIDYEANIIHCIKLEEIESYTSEWFCPPFDFYCKFWKQENNYDKIYNKIINIQQNIDYYQPSVAKEK